jgi:predicted permease
VALKDFMYAGRMLRNSPVFAITAVATIALGIGASTAIFSVTNAVLLRPLPYRNPERLVIACTDMRKRDVKDFPVSNADYFDLRNGARNNFEDFAAVRTNRGVVPRDDGTPEQVRQAIVTTNFFRLMGANIAIGRDFDDADGQPQPLAPTPAQGAAAPAPPRLPVMAILSHEYWQRRYGGNMSVLGHGLLGAKGGPQIVGILRPGFQLLFPPASNIEPMPDVWYAARLAYDNANRNNVSFRVIGRMKQGVSLDRAQSEADVVAAQVRRISPTAETAGFAIRLEPMQRHLVAEVRPAILALMGAVVFLLLIACASVGNLLLVRASLRERELAVRTALGGSRGRLVRQMLAEALVIAGLGALLGLALAWAGIRELLAIAPPTLPRMQPIAIDPVVLLFTVIAALAAAALFGITPAWRGSRPDVMNIFRSSGRTSGLSGGRLLRNGVVIAEVALSFVLLIGSGLMIRTFMALQQIDLGYNPHNLLTTLIVGGQPGNTPQAREAYIRALRDRLRSLPGVQAITGAFPLPLAGSFSPIRWGKEQALTDPTKFQATDFQIVLPGYFETMRTPLITGRTFTENDNAPERKLVIEDQVLAAKAFPNQSAIGKRILIRIQTPKPEWVESSALWPTSVRPPSPTRAASRSTSPMVSLVMAAWLIVPFEHPAFRRFSRLRCTPI